MHGPMSYRRFGRARSLRSDRALAQARSLRSDRAERTLGHYGATELWLELGRYVATELWLELGRYVATFFELLSAVSCFLRKAFLSSCHSSNLQNLSSSKSCAFNMSSSHGDKRSSDVEMGDATSPAPIPSYPVEAPACVADHLSFRERLVRRQAEKEQVRAGAEFPSSSTLSIAPGHRTEVVTPRDAGTLAGSGVPDASALPA
ncbi:hypothetical protein F2Q69_00041859 [Brassica cretica]|uniref:Uncharacterized protein n=1 Tax=Brassica cretica TaxID=69181 RepID=A0A8S9NA70_BRACR|nr:hypothetical protein F2Q69_00041859 [Brassica cretica]